MNAFPNSGSAQAQAVIYGRLSKGDASLESHEARNLKYAEMWNFNIVAKYEDEDTSGGVPMMDRPGGRSALNHLKQLAGVAPASRGSGINLIVAKLDRIGRVARDVLCTLEQLENLGVTLHIVDFGGSTITTQGHMGKLILTIFAGMAEWERNEIRDRTQKRMDYKFNNHELTGNVPFGFDAVYSFARKDTLIHSPVALSAEELARLEAERGECTSKMLVANIEEQGWIHTVAAWRAQGWSLKRIAEQLNFAGVKTKTPAGTMIKHHGQHKLTSGQWSTGNVDSLLKSRHTQRVLQTRAQREREAA